MSHLIEQTHKFYASYGNDFTINAQASGAYIFRPNGSSIPINSNEKSPLTVLRGPIVHEVHQKINSWIYQTTRLFKGKEHAEVEFIVGPIPIDDGVGKEIATEIKTNLASSKTFYTDSNGRDFIERVRDYRKDWNLEVNQPVAGNYYPINLGIYLRDKSKEFSVLVDRSVGGSSIVDGQLELMVHRRLLVDDSRGVAEALNETVCVSDKCRGLTVIGKYYFRIDPVGEGARWRRTFGQEIYSPFLLAFTESEGNWGDSHVTTFSGIDSSYSLPENVAIVTLQDLGDGKVLLRLAHLYEIGVGMVVSGLVEVRRRDNALKHGTFQSPTRIWWLIPQFGLSGLVEAFAAIPMMELLTSYWPDSMKTLGGAVFFLSLSIASWLSNVLIKIIVSLTKGNGGPHWLGGNDLNQNRLEHYYYTIAALGVLNLLYFVFFARRFLSSEVLQRQTQSEARDLENENHQ